MKLSRKVALALIFLTALALRLFLIFNRAPAGDEIWTFFLIQSEFKDIWLGTLSEMQLPFFFSFLRTLSLIFGAPLSILGMRLMALFFWILAAVGITFLAFSTLGRRVGIITFLLTLFLPSTLWVSISGRYYSFLILLATLAIAVFIRFLKSGKWQNLAFLTGVTILGVYTHYYFFLLPLVFSVYLFLTPPNRRFLRSWVYSVVCVFLLFAPALYYFLTLPKQQLWMRSSLFKIPAILVANVTSFETLSYTFYQPRSPLYLLYLIFLAALLVVLILLLILAWRSWKNDLRILFFLIMILPSTVILLISYTLKPILGIESVLGVNSLLIFLPAFLIVLANGLEADIKGKRILSASFLMLVVFSQLSFWQITRSFPILFEPYRFLKQEFKEGDLVLHADIYTFLQARYYLKKEVNFGGISTTFAAPTEHALGYKILKFEEVLKREGRVWYFAPEFYNLAPAQNFKMQLDKNLILVEGKYFPESITRVYLYQGK